MIKAKLGDRLDGWIQTAFPFLFHRPLSPNLLTAVGAAVSIAAAVVFATGRFVAGSLLMIAGGFFDLVDGVVARHQGRSSTFGAFLDSTLDRLVDMAILLGIAMHFAIVREAEHVLLAGVTLVLVVLVSYTKASAERYVHELDVGILERGERVGILALGAAFGFLVPALWIIAIGSAVTVMQRVVLAYHELERLDQVAKSSAGEPS